MILAILAALLETLFIPLPLFLISIWYLYNKSGVEKACWSVGVASILLDVLLARQLGVSGIFYFVGLLVVHLVVTRSHDKEMFSVILGGLLVVVEGVLVGREYASIVLGWVVFVFLIKTASYSRLRGGIVVRENI